MHLYHCPLKCGLHIKPLYPRAPSPHLERPLAGKWTPRSSSRWNEKTALAVARPCPGEHLYVRLHQDWEFENHYSTLLSPVEGGYAHNARHILCDEHYVRNPLLWHIHIFIYCIIFIHDRYLQNGVTHIVLVTYPPPSTVAAAPIPGHLCNFHVENISNFCLVLKTHFSSPSHGRKVCAPATAAAEKRTAPPPMIPKPLTAKKD